MIRGTTARQSGTRSRLQSGMTLLCMLGAAALPALSGCGITAPDAAKSSTGSSTAAAGVVPDGAQLGLAWNGSDATLRPITGVPGSAQFGSSIVVAGNYGNAAYSAQSNAALLIDKANNLYLLATPSGQPALLTQGISAHASIAFSPLGSSAVVFTPGAAAATVVRGLPQQPLASQVPAGSAILGAAIGEAGTLLLATGSGSGVAISTVTAGGARTAVTAMGAYGGMAFVAGSEDFLLADAAANTLARVHNGAIQVVAAQTDGLNKPLAVAASLDGRWAVTANRSDGTLVRVDLTSGTPPARSSCSCSPTGLTPLNGNAVFELTAPGASSSWMIEADDPTPRVLFIPPPRHG
jgi:hypothetical protein